LDNEWVISTWSPVHLRARLQEFYWKPDKPFTKAADFWSDTLRYVYLPRLKDRGVLAQQIVKGTATRDFFGTAYGEQGGKYDGFKLGDSNVQLDDTLLLIEPKAAAAYASTLTEEPIVKPPLVKHGDEDTQIKDQEKPVIGGVEATRKFKSFHGAAPVAAGAAKMRLVEIADEIVAVLASDPNAEVTVRIEVAASFPEGAQDHTKRAVSQNAEQLGFSSAEWE
jgi:hypothetical protein